MYKGKRLFDFIVSFLGIVFLSPLLIIIGLLVLINSGFPIIYRQKRIGKNWEAFDLYKFRTMRIGAQKQGYVCKKDDERVTAIGRLLRKRKLDELPQLFNVLKGEMSFVGPRPEILEFAEYYKTKFEQILSVKPGITDSASIRFRNESDLIGNTENISDCYLKEILSKKTEINSTYVQEANMLYDVNLILKTLTSLIFKG